MTFNPEPSLSDINCWITPFPYVVVPTIVGTTTYGKGVIQQLLSLRNGAGLKVTVEEYYTPNRTKINGVGIEPNEKVDLPESVENPLSVERKDDTQLQKAIEILKK